MSFFRKLFIPPNANPDEVRMTLGEHLEELRSRLIRAIIALVIGAVICYGFVGYIQSFLIWPVFTVYRAYGYEPVVHTFSPSESLILSFKVAGIVGLILSAPYSIMQIWGFVAAGLYPKERRWIRSFAPVSIALFFVGALFLIVVVNPLLLKFLLTYQTDLPDVSGIMPTWLVKSTGASMLKVTPTTQPTAELSIAELTARPPLPAFEHDPQGHVPDGFEWVNRTEHEKRVSYGGQIYSEAHLRPVGSVNRIQPDLRLDEIIPFTLALAAAFGIGFQVPVVVAFIAAIGLFQASQMAQYRRHVVFVMCVLAAVITPEPFSMMLLLIPMVGLFEAGLYAARRIERARAAQQTNPA